MYGELIVYLTQRSTDSYFSGVGNAIVVSAIAVSGSCLRELKDVRQADKSLFLQRCLRRSRII